jgi:hypothetical protein
MLNWNPAVPLANSLWRDGIEKCSHPLPLKAKHSHLRQNHILKKIISVLLAAGILTLSSCSTQRASKWEFRTVSSTSDKVLDAPVAQGWLPVAISVSSNGNRWFLLMRRTPHYHTGKWDYETISSKTDEILNTPVAQGWIVVSFCVTPDGTEWFLLKHKKS